jgi:serine/threonine-protein kinase
MEREGRLTSVRAVQLLLPIADALSAAHAKGFVHRDVKPDNVFVVVDDEQLQPKLVDFGIVKLAQHDKDSQLTQVGTVLGSPDYMSPEQARGLENIDPRSDVWSFSVMLYEAVAGQTPFSSTNYNALLRMIVEDEPASLQGLYAGDAELSAIVGQGLSKDPAQRFQSMSHLGRALAQWLVSQGISEDACGVSLEAKWLSRTTDPLARGYCPQLNCNQKLILSKVAIYGKRNRALTTLSAGKPSIWFSREIGYSVIVHRTGANFRRGLEMIF